MNRAVGGLSILCFLAVAYYETLRNLVKTVTLYVCAYQSGMGH